ncbi:MAG: site-2 protease family protein [Oscillospiraceae bacterium]|nr:site-2 protease family protein [Oscillospiraceae bacterium]
MGPAIYKKQGKNTLFTLRILPLGGYCAMGEDDEAKADDVNNFRNKSVGRRMAVILAGATMNLIMGFLIGIVILLADGEYTSATVAHVEEGSECAKYLSVNDEIISMNGMRLFTANDIVYVLQSDEDGKIDFVIRRDGQTVRADGVQFTLTDDGSGNRVLSYDFKVYRKPLTAAALLPQAGCKFLYYGRLIFMSLKDLLFGKYGLNQLSGPVGIVTTISQTVSAPGFDFTYLLELAMLISINVGIFNLLPLPALDGGRFLFLVIEAIRRKPISAEKEGMVHFIGFALLMLLMLAVTFNDIKRLIVPEQTSHIMVIK